MNHVSEGAGAGREEARTSFCVPASSTITPHTRTKEE